MKNQAFVQPVQTRRRHPVRGNWKNHHFLWLTLFLSLAAGMSRAAEPEAAVSEAWLTKKLDRFQDLKFGFMMHFGAYSQWGCIESWPLVEEDKWARPDDLPPWIERGKDLKRFQKDYVALPRTFNPIHFDPKVWAKTAKGAGMKYVVFTTKHHDGFCLFDTHLTDYRVTAPDVPFHTNAHSNITREVFRAFRRDGFAIGAYFSKADWHSPDFWDPTLPAHTRNPNYDTKAQPEKWQKFVDFTHGQIEELMTGYGHIDILWLDAGQVRPPNQDIQMDRLAAMARRHQPGILIVDRTVGGPYENYRTPEQEVPDKPLPYVWESCLTMGSSWSFKPNDQYKSTHQLIRLLVDIVSKGGNLLLNVGPQPDGRLPEPAMARMEEIGAWLKVNGQAIYGTRPIAPFKEGNVAFTRKGKTVYAICMSQNENEALPESINLTTLQPKAGSKVHLLGVRKSLPWEMEDSGKVVVHIPVSVRQSPPCRDAMVLEFEPAHLP